MPVNVEQTAAFAALAKSFTSSYEARDQLANALREHLGVTPRDSFWMSDDGIDDMLGPVVIYQFNRDVFDGNGGLPVKGSPGSADSFFRATYARTAGGFVFGEPVAVRRRTDYVRDSAVDEGAEPGSDEAELPAWLAEALARAAGLVKGAGHRYIRRVPKAGGGYRYFYKVSGGKGLGHEDEMQVGAKFRVTNGGKDGHFEIVGKNENGTLRIKHDESGHESVVSPLALRSMLRAEHAQSLTAHREKLAADIKAADDPKAKARLLAEAGKYEHTRDLAGGESEADERARVSAKGRSNRERLSMAPMASSPLPPPQGAKPDPRDDWHRDHGHLADRIVAGDMSAGPNGGVQARYKTHEVDGKTKPVSGEIHGQYGVHQSDMGDDRFGRDPKYKVTHLPTGKSLGPEMSETDAHKLAQTFDSKHKHAGGDVPVGGSIDAGEFKKMSATFKKFMQARQNERDKVQKSMSTVTDPERDFAKSLATSHRTAAQAQPDSGAKAAHESAAQACDAAALAGSTGEFRKALGASERIGGLIKAWTGIPVQQRPPFDDFRKSMTSPTQARPFTFTASNGNGDALGHMPAVVAGSRPAVETPTAIAPEPTTYSAQRGAVNGLRKSMGTFYGQLAAGASQARLDVRFPAEAAQPAGGR